MSASMTCVTQVEPAGHVPPVLVQLSEHSPPGANAAWMHTPLAALSVLTVHASPMTGATPDPGTSARGLQNETHGPPTTFCGAYPRQERDSRGLPLA